MMQGFYWANNLHVKCGEHSSFNLHNGDVLTWNHPDGSWIVPSQHLNVIEHGADLVEVLRALGATKDDVLRAATQL